jgi:magnesium chelatase family protein
MVGWTWWLELSGSAASAPLMLYVYGIDASITEVEVDVSGIKTNEDYFHTVGLPDQAVRESRDRVRAALKNCGYDIPPTHTTINLAPADIRKEGSGFDLPMALGILGVRGMLPIAIEARGKKIPRLTVPELNGREAAMVGGFEIYPVKSLLDVIRQRAEQPFDARNSSSR